MVPQNSFEIKLPQFEGPFDLLLFFIERDELDIHEIAIAKITDEFLDYIHHLTVLNIDIASEFIFVAATLMRIKAKMLLPHPGANESESELDAKQDLIQKLIEYKKFKQLSEGLKDLEDKRFQQERRGNIGYDMNLIAHTAVFAEELASVDLYKLMRTYHQVINRYELRENEPVHTIIQYPYTIENQKKVITQLIAINKRLDFKTLLAQSENKVHFVYNFLAILEMLQQELISIQIGLGFNNFWIADNRS
ncbi:MAG: segregation/condensation protein A [Sphingobacteriaceae bacterium]|jgi:segregation and condensation protein A|nr:MAG: chromosome segregation protein ScpA [Pedobacter sp.]